MRNVRKSPPPEQPTDREKLVYVAEAAAELRRLLAEPQFRTVAYLLDMARLEAERMAKGLPDDTTPPPPTPARP